MATLFSESDLISVINQTQLQSHTHVVRGIGDDCAVLKKDEQTSYVMSTDAMVEGVHFDLKFISRFDVGRRAAAAALSDIAAMAAIPVGVLVTLAITPQQSRQDILDLYAGLNQCFSEFGIGVIGGDTVTSRKLFMIDLTVIGEAPTAHIKYRHLAKPGDDIYVTGVIGSAAVGLAQLKKNRSVNNVMTQAHKLPRPKIHLASRLGQLDTVHAMIDVSDGLLKDLGHIANASHVGAALDLDDVPRDDFFAAFCDTLRLDETETLLSGGEDYQILFTADPRFSRQLPSLLSQLPHAQITRIGKIVDWTGPETDVANPAELLKRIQVTRAGQQVTTLSKTGYEHSWG